MNVYFSVVDGGSATLTKIADKTKALDKETQQLEQSYKALTKANEGLIRKKTVLQGELQEVNKEVREARKAFNQLADEANSDAYEKAQRKQEDLRAKIAETTKAIKENEKIYKSNMETVRKGINDSGGEAGLNSIARGLMASQVGSQLSGALGGIVQTMFSSEMGMPAASRISDVLGGAISGGAAGAALGPWGIAGGAALGAFSGLLTSQTKVMEAADDAFKDYYKTLIDDANARTEASITSGSAIAGSREKDKISFSTLFGSEEKADDYLKSMVTMANTTPFLYDDLKDMSKTLATYGWDETGILPVLGKIGDAGAALGMAASDMSAVATALGRMRSSDKASLEYLNILNDRGIGAVGYLAEARGVSVGDMYGMISKNEISGTEAVDILLEALERDFAGSMLAQSRTFEGLSSTREGLMQEIDNAGGEGYNTIRNQGLQEDIDAYGGRLGDALQSLAEVEGQTRAAFDSSEESKTLQEVTLDQIAATRDSIAAMGSLEGALHSYNVSQEESKGMGAKNLAALSSSGDAPERVKALWRDMQAVGAGEWGSPSAVGLDRVPYDNFPALLHEGERVLTAQQVREADRSDGGGDIHITVNVDGSGGDGEELADQIADIIVQRLELARMRG